MRSEWIIRGVKCECRARRAQLEPPLLVPMIIRAKSGVPLIIPATRSSDSLMSSMDDAEIC